jgi:hypothetical protein
VVNAVCCLWISGGRGVNKVCNATQHLVFAAQNLFFIMAIILSSQIPHKILYGHDLQEIIRAVIVQLLLLTQFTVQG